MQQWQGHSHDICSRSASQGEGDPSLHFWERAQEWMGDSAQTVLSSRAFAFPSLSLLGTSWVNPGGENEVDGHCETSLRGVWPGSGTYWGSHTCFQYVLWGGSHFHWLSYPAPRNHPPSRIFPPQRHISWKDLCFTDANYSVKNSNFPLVLLLNH